MPQPEPLSKSAETSLVALSPRSLNVIEVINSEPNSRLYLFNQQSAIKKQDVHTPAVNNNRKPVQASTKQDINKNRLHPIKKLSRKFRKNGLGIVDSNFNSRFFYYIWKTEKSKNQGKYSAYIALMTLLAKLYGSLADLFAPLIAFICWVFKPESVNKKRRRLAARTQLHP